MLLQIDHLDPVRLRAHRVVADRLQFAARLVDRVDRHPGRVHADRQQELAARVDREAARRLLGREAADLGQGSGQAAFGRLATVVPKTALKALRRSTS